MMHKNLWRILLLLGALFIHCSTQKGAEMSSYTCDNTIDNACILRISGMKIFFGHQSVGENILDGVREIVSIYKGSPSVSIASMDDSTEITTPALYHYSLGKNGDPIGKMQDFSRILHQKNHGSYLDVACMKLCYVDISSSTDVVRLFKQYTAVIAQIKKDFPNLTIVHSTVPLTVYATGVKSKIKRLLIPDDNNKRCEYNDLIRTTFSGIDPIFDIAAVESTDPAGTRQSYLYQKKSYFSLIPAYSSDGGHLNSVGKCICGKAFLQTIGLARTR
ncbi:MAG: hypothetical protein JW795_16035 [Chitinivibrionales bacterium]|nr:hypothetical protein [Chitinivibrionales bacterium]